MIFKSLRPLVYKIMLFSIKQLSDKNLYKTFKKEEFGIFHHSWKILCHAQNFSITWRRFMVSQFYHHFMWVLNLKRSTRDWNQKQFKLSNAQLNIGAVGKDKKVDQWHFDSINFVAVLIFSNIDNMIGTY